MKKFANAVRRFHGDEEGMEAFQSIMLLALAALAAVVLKSIGQSTLDKGRTTSNTVMEAFTGGGGTTGTGGGAASQ